MISGGAVAGLVGLPELLGSSHAYNLRFTRNLGFNGIAVALLNVYKFSGVETMSEADKAQVYVDIFQLALLIPLISVLGVTLAGWLKLRNLRRLRQQGYTRQQAWAMIRGQTERPAPNWWILIGSLVFVLFTISIGLSELPYNEEIIFTGSMLIVLFLMARLVRVLDESARRVLVGTAIIIFVYRAMPLAGAGETWWMIDQLGFDQRFLSILSLITRPWSVRLLGVWSLISLHLLWSRSSPS